jgi:AraC family transcriptional regulator
MEPAQADGFHQKSCKGGKMLTVVAEIKTPTTKVEVMQGAWPRPVELTWKDPWPVVTLLFRSSNYKTEGRFVDGGRKQPLDKIGKVFFIPPNNELYGWGSGGEIKAARCSFDPVYYEKILGESGRLTSSQLRNSLDIHSSLSSMLLIRLMEEALSPGFAADVLAESLGTSLLLECIAQTSSRVIAELTPKGGLTRRQLRIIEDYIHQLEENPELNPPSVSRLAGLCGLSVRQFCRLFRGHMGQTVGQYLGTVRIGRAQSLLIDTDLPLKEIAFRLGFANAGNFSTAFRAAMRQPPAAFRRQHQGISRI